MDDKAQVPTPPQAPQVNNPPPASNVASNQPSGNPWIKWVLIILAATVLFSGGTYFVLSKKTQPLPSPMPKQVSTIPSPTPDPTANWKTYSNDDYKFTFSYPLSWKLEERASESSTLTLLLSDTMQEGVSEEGAKNIWIDVNKITTSLDLHITRSEKPKYELVEDKTVGENTFKIVRVVGDPAYVPKSYLVENKGTLVSIRNWNFETIIFEKLLSTFRFL